MLNDNTMREKRNIRPCDGYMAACNDRYLSLAALADDCYNCGHFESALRLTGVAANFAWLNHTGRFADGRIENVAFAVGRQLDGMVVPLSASVLHSSDSIQCCRRVVLVASSVDGIGGHSRSIYQWIEHDKASCFTLILTNQQRPVPEWIGDVVARQRGRLVRFTGSESILEVALAIRRYAQKAADIVLLYHHPNDPVPTVAFATADGPPVAFRNHSDMAFSLGVSVTDAMIHYRLAAAQVSRERRGAGGIHCILRHKLEPRLSRVPPVDARTALGLCPEDVMLLCVSAQYKLTPNGRVDFYRVMSEILTRHPAAHLVIVGVTDDQRSCFPDGTPKDRLHLLGRQATSVNGALPYHEAADIYLEGFPMGSLNAFLEACAIGLCAVAGLRGGSKLLQSLYDPLEAVLTYFSDQADYIAYVGQVIDNAVARRQTGLDLQSAVLAAYINCNWQDQLEVIYAQLRKTGHNPGPINRFAPMQSIEDRELSRFHYYCNGGHVPTVPALAGTIRRKISPKEWDRLRSVLPSYA